MMIQLLLIKLNDIYSLHREFLEMIGCLTMLCTVMRCNVMLMDVSNAVVMSNQWFLSVL